MRFMSQLKAVAILLALYNLPVMALHLYWAEFLKANAPEAF